MDQNASSRQVVLTSIVSVVFVLASTICIGIGRVGHKVLGRIAGCFEAVRLRIDAMRDGSNCNFLNVGVGDERSRNGDYNER